MEPGRFVYQQTLERGEELGCWIALAVVFVGTIGYSLSQGQIAWVGVFLFIAFLFFGVLKTLYKKESFPAFYEHGVVLYCWGNPQEFLSYDAFECFLVGFYYEDHGEDSTRFYSIACVQQGKAVAYLRSEHLNEFQAVWQQLILLHPELNDRLYPMDERNRKHHQLCDELKGYY